MQKGWRLVTSHKRLADMMHKPCRCPANYEHAKCEGRNASLSARYTKEFGRLVYEALSREGGFGQVVQECSGASQLPECFGLGLRCSCGEPGVLGSCGSCIASHGADMCGAAVKSGPNLSEPRAREALLNPRGPSSQELWELLRQPDLFGHSCRFETHYHLGLNQGEVEGKANPETLRVLNLVLGSQLPKGFQWTSVHLIRHPGTMARRNDMCAEGTLTGCIGLGDVQGGRLWVEDVLNTHGVDDVPNTGVSGRGPMKGKDFEVQLKGVVIQDQAWHSCKGCEGDFWLVRAYVNKSWSRCTPEAQQEPLSLLEFQVPSVQEAHGVQSPRSLGNVLESGSETSNKEQACPAEHRTEALGRSREDEKIRRQLYLLHCATGHSHPRHMVQALKRRGTSKRVIELAESFTCPVCQERSKPAPRNLASLEPLPPKLATVCADIGHWVHPQTQEKLQFMVIIDEGSRYRTARFLSRGSKQAPNAQACLHYLQEGWVQYFGHPRCLRLDPAGAFRSQSVEDWCDKHGIYLDVVPGEAHWKIGTCENAILGLKTVMQKLVQYDESLTPEEVLSEAVTTFNNKELVRGYSPAQHILGQAPDETGRFLPAGEGLPPGLLCENASGEFERSVLRRAEAEKALCEWAAKQRLMRAKHSRHRPCYNYVPGELVFYWRSQEANKSRRQPGSKHGRFLGPARILATESRKGEDGQLKPGSVVWLVKGRHLLKCAPEQLGRATQREELLEAMAEPSTQQTPWTFHRVAEEIGGNRFEDISSDLPNIQEWNRAQQVEEEVQPTRFRARHKRPAGALEPTAAVPGDLDLPDYN